jgi:hypothetical protein
VRRFNDEVNLRVPPSSPGRHQDHLTRQKASFSPALMRRLKNGFTFYGG